MREEEGGGGKRGRERGEGEREGNREGERRERDEARKMQNW